MTNNWISPFCLTWVLCIGILQGSNAQEASFIDPQTAMDVSPLLALEDTYSLEFSDEFNDTSIDEHKWQILVSERSRTPRPGLSINDWWWVEENVSEVDGNLVLKVSKHDHNTMYCGSINANNKYERRYGYYETRIKIAEAAKGTHTAFWFTGDHQGNIDGTGNDGAEVDVFESAWLGDFTKAVVHIDGYGGSHQSNTKRYDTPGLHEGFHTWGFLWLQDTMKIYYDGALMVSYTGIWVPQEEQYIWLSDGASFGIKGDYFTSQSIGPLTEAYVDYIRVWRQEDPPIDSLEFALEAECDKEKGIDWYYGETESVDQVSNGFYIEVSPEVTESLDRISLARGTIVYDFTNPVAQEYLLWARMQVTDVTKSGLWYAANGNGFKLSTPTLSQAGDWEWALLSDQVYFNKGLNEFSIGFKDPGIKIDKFWLANYHETPLGLGENAGVLCQVDTTTNGDIGEVIVADTVSFEAELLQIEGESFVTSCAAASGGELVNLKQVGGIVLASFDVVSGGKYDLNIGYISANERRAALHVNGTVYDTLIFPGGGTWCGNNVSMAAIEVPITLNTTGNSIAIRPVGTNGPHIDKFTASRHIDPVEVNIHVDTNSLTEGETTNVSVTTSEPVVSDQIVALSLTGVTEGEVILGNYDLVIEKDQTMAQTILEVPDDHEILGERVFTVSIASTTALLVAGEKSLIEISIRENDEPIEVTLSTNTSEINEGEGISITATANMPVPIDQKIKLKVDGTPTGEVFGHYLQINANETQASSMLVFEDDIAEGDIAYLVTIDSASTLLVPTSTLTIKVLGNANILAIGNEKHNNLSVYPNPTWLKLFIEGDLFGAHAEITDLSGKAYGSFQIIDKQVDISNLPPGMYVLHVRMKKTDFQYRFLKK